MDPSMVLHLKEYDKTNNLWFLKRSSQTYKLIDFKETSVL